MEDDSMLLQSLFKSKNPEDPNEVPGGFLTDVNKQLRARHGSELKAVSRASSRLVYCAAENSQWTPAENVRACLMMECGPRAVVLAVNSAPAADALL
ncbi:hypothetical protein ANCCEY_05847 [Ancylostoma ceylanicum]|uniref:Uncharacterized protein n=1 Tax=Ancylostoma ceylanicum TaxID=53326 RepID=A0A0D6M591_9BILA|nr:hypothetical protein ANCCEY_05847 [Ancylostoma ceylanicum]